MISTVVHVEIDDQAWTRAEPQAEALVRSAARAALVAVDAAAGAELTLLLTDDESVRALNARFRGVDKATNVLSFPAPDTAAPHLGDIALAFGVCAEEAQAQAKPLGHHLAHLVVHGVLHLIGYDHEADSDAEAMEHKERAILAGLGIPDPYTAREADG